MNLRNAILESASLRVRVTHCPFPGALHFRQRLGKVAPFCITRSDPSRQTPDAGIGAAWKRAVWTDSGPPQTFGICCIGCRFEGRPYAGTGAAWFAGFASYAGLVCVTFVLKAPAP